MRQFRFSWLIRHRKYVVSGFLVLILVGILTVSITNSSTNDQSLRHDNDKMITNNDIDIYDDFIEQERQFTKKRPLRDTKPRAALSPDQKEFVNNRIRTLKTILGAVVLKDYLFTPRYPGLWKGYSKKKSDLKRLLSSDWDSDKHEGAEQNSNSLEQKPDSDVIKNLLGDFKQKEVQESRLKRKKLDPKARLQNTAMKLAALYAKLSSKNKDFNRTLDKDPNNAHNSLSQGDCNKPLCVEYLTSQDADQFQYCTKKAKLESSIAPQVSVCHFMNGTKRNSVALAGYPASGHTQVSQLLQHVTGLCTGGINCDITLRRNGFPGESIVSGAVLVVRTIEPEPHWTGLKYKSKENVPVFGSAIYLIRNPLKAMSEVWMSEKVEPGNLDNFVSSQTLEWQQTVLAWVVNTMDHPVLVIKYEDLVENTQRELKKMLDFLQVPYKTSQLEQVRSLDIVEDNRHQERAQPNFSEQHKEYILSIVHSAMTSLEEAGLSETCDLSSYYM